MTPPELFAHPFSSYCQKALVALYENETVFTYRNLDDPPVRDTLAALWPLQRFPVLREGGRTVPEASIIIEYLDLHHPGRHPLVPREPELAWQVRMLDRFFDNYVATPQQKIVFDSLRPEDARDGHGVAEVRRMLDVAYEWLEGHMAGREWAEPLDVAELPRLLEAASQARLPIMIFVGNAHCIQIHTGTVDNL